MQQPPIATGGRAINPAVAKLAAIDRWVCWRSKERDGKPTKVPFTPAGSAASATDPDKLVDFRRMLAGGIRGRAL